MSTKDQIPSYDELVAIVRAIVPRCICDKPARHKVLYKQYPGVLGPSQSSVPVCSRECFEDVRVQLHKGTIKPWDGKPVEFTTLNELTTRLSILVETIECGLKGEDRSKHLDDASIRFSLLELD
jgi:hypothetical protein